MAIDVANRCLEAKPGECRVSRPEVDESDNRPDLKIARRAAEQWGVLSLGELRECGLSNDAIAGRVRNGRLHRMHRTVYAVGHENVPLEGRFLAAVKACGPAAVLSHFSAAALFGFLDWDDREFEVIVIGTGTRTHPGLRVHRASWLDRRDRARCKQIPVTSPARTPVDLASFLGRPLRRAVRQAQSLRLVSHAQLGEILGRLGPRRGVCNLRRILAIGPSPTRTELEDAVLDLIVSGGLAPPDVNVPLELAGRSVVPDFRWPEQHLVVEADGAAWHEHKLAREDDAERQALLEAHGERVIRVTWHQAIAQRTQTLGRLRSAGAPERRVSS